MSRARAIAQRVWGRRLPIRLRYAQLRAWSGRASGRLDGNARFCPICRRASPFFRPFGVIPRDDAQCIYCGSLERHRLLWLYLSTHTDLLDGSPRKMLHVAPEACLETQFKRHLKGGYITADLLDPRAMVAVDITNIQYPAESFDVIYCSHVLEHVQDDRKAMREFHRVLKRDGWAILLVPITADRTYEDPSIVSPQDRLREFGQEDHVRRYGPDYLDRLRDTGFDVETITIGDFVGADKIVPMGLAAAGDIYYCTKQQSRSAHSREGQRLSRTAADSLPASV